MSLKEKQKEAIYYTVFPISGRDIYVRCAPYGVWKVAYIYIRDVTTYILQGMLV